MEKNQLRLNRKSGGLGVVWLSGAVLAAACTWVILSATYTTERLLVLLGLAGLCALQSFSLAQGLHAESRLSHGWRYRMAFLMPVALYLFYWLIQGLMTMMVGEWPDLMLFLSGLAAVSLAAFSGGLIATALNEGLWENNSPPPPDIEEAVHQMHLSIIGVHTTSHRGKRIFDIFLSLLGLVISLPVWLVSVFLVWFEDPGPLLFVKNSVGLGGANFHQFKLRTMVRGAEENTGPVLSEQDDQRILTVGRPLRKTALDELPQLINILLGEMSFVGPRPQRTVLVHDYLQTIPAYARRHAILPGLAGLAQVAGDYYLTPRQKLRYDLLYIRYAGLGFDIKLITLAFALAFWFRWQPDWNGRLPRRLLRFGSRNKFN